MRWFDYGIGYENWFASGNEVDAWLNRVYAMTGALGWWLAVAVVCWVASRWMISGGLKPHWKRAQDGWRVLAHRRAMERLARRRIVNRLRLVTAGFEVRSS